VAKLSPITSRINALMDDKAELDNILKAGNERANEQAEKTLKGVKDHIGFWS